MKKKFSINKGSYKAVGLGLLMSAAISCEKMEGINADEKLISDLNLQQDANEGGFLLPAMMNSVVSTTTSVQTQQNLQAESYSGFMESPTPFLNNQNTMTYFMVGGWLNTAWNVTTQGVMDNWLLMKKRALDTKYPDLFAIALILKVAGGQRLVDTFGPYPYTKYGTAAQVTFDSEEEAYNAFFTELDQAVAALLAAEKTNPNADVARFAKWDRSVFKGEYTKWTRLANTLRLRMAIRISLVNPAKAKTEAEKAVDPANGGVLTDAIGSYAIVPTATNPYFTMTNAWSDTRVAAPVETFLKGFGDPRLPLYALPATDPAAAGQIKGIRPGVEKPAKDRYQDFSKPNVTETSPVKQVDVAESYFLRAEGALRGWNMGGTAQQFYEDGIKASFKANGAGGVDAYLQSTTTQVPYVDPKNPANNSPALTNVTVKWEESATMEQKLEKIITQKWVALYPEGTEAWAEFRRTGYPKLYPIVISNNPDLPVGTYIKRLTYPPVVTNASKAAVDKAVADHLGGKDSPASRIWWDVR